MRNLQGHQEAIRITVVLSRGRLAVVSVFALSLTLLSWPAVAKAQSTPQGKEWRVKYILPEEVREGLRRQVKQVDKNVEVSLGPEWIAGKSEKDAEFLIPVAQVLELTYNTQVHHRGKGWVEAGEVAGSGGGYSGILAVPFLLGAAAVSPTHATKHFVYIAWRDQGEVRGVLLEASKDDYRPFLQELRRGTGKEWKDLPAEREKTRQEIEREKAREIPVKLDHRVWLAGMNLKAGAYHLVLLQREENRGELYFFAGKKMDSLRVAGMSPVEIERLPTGVAAAQVTYKDEQGITMISEIRTADKILRPAAQTLP